MTEQFKRDVEDHLGESEIVDYLESAGIIESSKDFCRTYIVKKPFKVKEIKLKRKHLLHLNHYCAKHHKWWHTSKHKDCPICLENKKRKCTKQICFCENNGVCLKEQ